MKSGRVEMVFQCATLPISAVIEYLEQIKKKYGNIPVGSYNANGMHIEVNRSDKDPDIHGLRKFKRNVKIAQGVYRTETEPNPESLYVHIW